MIAATQTLADFLLQRIAEDEAVAEQAGSFTPWSDSFQNDNYGHLTVQPARVLAECKANREIVEGHREIHVCPNLTDDGFTDYSSEDEDGGYQPCPTLHALASIYADHPEFRSEWSA